nr:unnamed protein product [Digitaria exilis]
MRMENLSDAKIKFVLHGIEASIGCLELPRLTAQPPPVHRPRLELLHPLSGSGAAARLPAALHPNLLDEVKGNGEGSLDLGECWSGRVVP